MILTNRRKACKIVGITGTSAKVRSELDSPIKLAEFRPVACDSLARIGSVHDGGYVVPLNAVKAADALLSFGLSHDWTFERDFKKQNPNAIIHCYDHTVSSLTAFQYSIGQFLRFLASLRTRYLQRAFTWIYYPLFFRADKIHFRQRIWRDRQDSSATIEDAFRRLPAGCQVFVKMDIEGSEYQILDDLLRHSKEIVALAIEFHNVDVAPQLFNSAIEGFKRDFCIVHIHGNNLGGMTTFNFPIAPEITLLNKRFFDSPPLPSRLNYPVPGLDSPNHPGLPDYTFEF
jgi:hypothetical protein